MMENFPIVNAVYAYDDWSNGGVILLDINHCIYMADKNDDVIACLNKMRIHGIHVDEHPSIICPHEDNTQCIITDGI